MYTYIFLYIIDQSMITISYIGLFLITLPYIGTLSSMVRSSGRAAASLCRRARPPVY